MTLSVRGLGLPPCLGERDPRLFLPLPLRARGGLAVAVVDLLAAHVGLGGGSERLGRDLVDQLALDVQQRQLLGGGLCLDRLLRGLGRLTVPGLLLDLLAPARRRRVCAGRARHAGAPRPHDRRGSKSRSRSTPRSMLAATSTAASMRTSSMCRSDVALGGGACMRPGRRARAARRGRARDAAGAGRGARARRGRGRQRCGRLRWRRTSRRGTGGCPPAAGPAPD